MQVQLDEERWEMADTLKLEDIITHISDAAHARGCLVTTLTVGERPFSDRDLVPAVLAQEAGTFGRVVATSQPLQSVMKSGAESAWTLGSTLRDECGRLVRAFRKGEQRFRQLDDWFGQLADYVEWAELARQLHVPQAPSDSLVSWLEQVVQARERNDLVALADLLEYEVCPRLPSGDASTYGARQVS